MLFDALVAAIIISLIAGGRFSRLGRLGLRWPWVFVAAFAVRALIRTAGVLSWQPVLAVAGAAHLFSYGLLLAAVAANRHLWPMWIAAVGVLANLAVIAANRGAMPVAADLVRASGQTRLLSLIEQGRFPTHRIMTSDTRLAFLADRLFLAPPYPRPCVFSVGDVFITIGVVLLVVWGMGAFGWRRRETGAAQQEPA